MTEAENACAAIVAWLRGGAGHQATLRQHADILLAAKAIEAGEHHKGSTDGESSAPLASKRGTV